MQKEPKLLQTCQGPPPLSVTPNLPAESETHNFVTSAWEEGCREEDCARGGERDQEGIVRQDPPLHNMQDGYLGSLQTIWFYIEGQGVASGGWGPTGS